MIPPTIAQTTWRVLSTICPRLGHQVSPTSVVASHRRRTAPRRLRGPLRAASYPASIWKGCESLA